MTFKSYTFSNHSQGLNLMTLPTSILIVEDDPSTQILFKEILGQFGIENITCIDNASDAMAYLSENSINMILMDINIKGPTDGIRLANKIMDNYVIPIVFVTQYYDQETVKEVLELSPYGFIRKPFSYEDLLILLQVAYKRFLTHEKTHSFNLAEFSQDHIKINEEFSYSLKRSTLYQDDKPVRLSLKQNKLIETLSKELNQTISFDALVTNIWQGEIVADSSLRTLVYTIRKSIPSLPLFSHSKVGYTLEGKSI